MRDDDLERWVLREDRPPQSRARLWIAVGIAIGVLWLVLEWREPIESDTRENWATGGVPTATSWNRASGSRAANRQPERVAVRPLGGSARRE
jgi:hypothetical protein